MSGFILDEKTKVLINTKLLSISEIQKRLIDFDPEIISLNINPESNIPVSLVCINDCCNTLVNTRYALYELYAHLYWYAKLSPNPSNYLALFYSRFFADDVSLRLYSSGEHLANAIENMLDIDSNVVKKCKGKSKQIRIGKYLIVNYHDFSITESLKSLSKNKSWIKTINYRNNWVHNQPPLIAGMGIQYKRKIRWEFNESTKYYNLNLLSPDKPDFKIDEVIEFLTEAYNSIVKVFETVFEHFCALCRNVNKKI